MQLWVIHLHVSSLKKIHIKNAHFIISTGKCYQEMDERYQSIGMTEGSLVGPE